MSLYRVAPGATVLDYQNNLREAGYLFERGYLRKETIASHLQSGHIIQATEAAAPQTAVTNVPGTTAPVPIPGLDTKNKQGQGAGARDANGKEILTVQTPEGVQEDRVRAEQALRLNAQHADASTSAPVVQTGTAGQQATKSDGTRRSLWSFNPENISKWGLKSLNAKIAELDPSIRPFDTVEEARAFLSKDYSPNQTLPPQ